LEGRPEHREGVYTDIHDRPSTGPTTQALLEG